MNYEQQINQALARAYCTLENSSKELDAVLINAMTQEVLKSVGFIPKKDSNAVEQKMPEGEDPNFWEKLAKERESESRYYQAELLKAHTLLGRVIHQLSERWDSVNLSKYFPTDNLWGKRTFGNAKGEKRYD